MHHEYMIKISSCHLEGGLLSTVNRCFEYVVDGWFKHVWVSGTKGGEGKIDGGSRGGLGQRTSSSSIVGWLSVMNTSSRPRLDKSRSMTSITESTKGSLGSSRVSFFRNDEIGFRGSGSTTNMFISGGFEEAPIVGSGSWYNDSLSFLLVEGSFCGLAWGSNLSGVEYVMHGKIPLGLKGLRLGCVMANGWRFWLGEVDENEEVKGMDRSLYNDCRGW